MNETIDVQLKHRTIREFKSDPIPEDTFQTLMDVAMHTPTSRGIQSASIIRIKDQGKREKLAEIGGQEYVARAPEYLLFIADLARGAAILEEMGLYPQSAATIDTFQEAFTDAVLMVQNVVVAAESLGLGANILGNILNEPKGVIEAIGLPPYTFPVLGLTLGYPGEEPQIKPRMPKEFRVMTDTYVRPDSYLEALKDYDAQMREYYDLRNKGRREDKFTSQIFQKLGRYATAALPSWMISSLRDSSCTPRLQGNRARFTRTGPSRSLPQRPGELPGPATAQSAKP